MSASSIREFIRYPGLSVRLGVEKTLTVTPTLLLKPDFRKLIQGHKHDLVVALTTQTNDDTSETCITNRHLLAGDRCNNHRHASLAIVELSAEFI